MNYVKQIIVILISVCSFQLASAQSNYISHTLKEGESLSTLAQQYNTSVGDIMRMNGMHADTKLVYGSKIKIPSTKPQTNVAKKESSNTATVKSNAATSTNEITHIVTKGETLYSISKKYNITVDEIKTWNHLADDNAKVGTLLVISDEGINKVAATSSQNKKVETAIPVEEKKEVVDNDINNNPPVETKSENKIDDQQPALQTENNTGSLASDKSITDYSGQGYFFSQFKERKNKNTQTVSGISKTFKTASGWTDGKYYILANDIEPGTIVKLTVDNGTAVYAKVLWNMGDIKDNAGINFRVSNATAAALRENDDSFKVNVSY